MDSLTTKRKLIDISASGQDITSNQTAVSKFQIKSPKTVCNAQSDSKENTQVPIETRPTNLNKSMDISSLQFATVVPINSAVTTRRTVLSSPTSTSCIRSPVEQPTRKFRYASLRNGMKNDQDKNSHLKRPPLHPEVSVKSTVATQTAPSFLRKISPVSKPADLLAVCSWCGYLSKNFVKCDRCHHTLESTPKTCTPQPLLSKISPRLPAPASIATLLPQAIVITPQVDAAAALFQQTPIVTKGQFYGHQMTTIQAVPAATFFQQTTPNGTSKLVILAKPPSPKKTYRGKKKAEPECLTISSDEEQDDTSKKAHEEADSDHSNMFSSPSDTESTTNELLMKMNQTTVIQSSGRKSLVDYPSSPMSSSSDSGSPTNEADESMEGSSDQDTLVIKCRSIRIGSYKVQAHESHILVVRVTTKEFKFSVTSVQGNKVVTIIIQKDDIASVLAHFGKSLPVLFIYTTPGCGGVIRSQLNMSNKDKLYYDPCAADESMKRITILPIALTDQQKHFLLTVYPGSNLLQEIKQVVANEILVRSTPIILGPHYVGLVNTGTTEQKAQLLILQTQAPKTKKEVTKLVTYPAPPQTGGIEINSEDLECLNEGEFLNDVIIDFYLKYLVNEKLSPGDRKRTHIFSSFFFPRLITKKPEEETSISLVKRRHARVKTWTRHVDIFDKDFIVVPINQNSHWFLAVICFPGSQPPDLTKPRGAEPSCPEPESDEYEPASANGQQLAGDESMADSPADYASNSENMEIDDLESPLPPTPPAFNLSSVPLPGEEVESAPTSSPSTLEEDKGPVILIFDSLPGNHRWKIVQILREYLSMEYETKKNGIRNFDRNSMKGINVVKVPRQDNYSDCGIYLLQYVESFFENPLNQYVVPLPDLYNWFPESKISGKRVELKELILALQKQQQENNATKTPSKSSNLQKSV